ncbi:MAG: hypothetical protein ACI9WU_005120 [Myxococcota bacterium]|jgi:hypothetical protein
MAVIGAASRATHESVCIEHSPNITTPVGSTFIVVFSQSKAQSRHRCQPVYQSVSGILDQILAVLPSKNRMEGGMDAGLRLVEKRVGKVVGTGKAQTMTLGVRVLVSQAGQY